MAYEEGRQDTDLASQFREVMAGVATPVSVVTTIGTGQPFGTTVSAFPGFRRIRGVPGYVGRKPAGHRPATSAKT